MRKDIIVALLLKHNPGAGLFLRIPDDADVNKKPF